MGKSEFLAELDCKLKALNEKERQDIITEYSQYIDDKMAEGLSEEEATATFGDIDELVKELLLAYSSDPDFKYKSVGNVVGYFFSKAASFINDMANAIPQMSGREVVSFLIKLSVVIFVLWLVRLPFEIARSAFTQLFSFLPMTLYNLIYNLVHLAFDLVYGIIFVYTIYIFVLKNIVENRRGSMKATDEEFQTGGHYFFDGSPYKKPQQDFEESLGEESEDSQLVNEPMEGDDDLNKENITEGFVPPSFAKEEIPPYKPHMGRRVAAASGSFMEGFIVMILKFFAGLVVFIGMIPLLICIVSFGVAVSFVIQGFPLIGLTLILLGSVLCGLAIIVPLCNFISHSFRRNEEV